MKRIAVPAWLVFLVGVLLIPMAIGGYAIFSAVRFSTLYGPAERALEPAYIFADALSEFRKRNPGSPLTQSVVEDLLTNPQTASLRSYPVLIDHNPEAVTFLINKEFFIIISETEQSSFWTRLGKKP